MPPFVPPSEPPALVQPVVPQPNRDRFPSFPSSRAVPSNDQDSATLSNPPDRAQSTPPLTANDAQPSSIPLSVTEVPPTVVEVYFSNPQEVSLPPGSGQPASSGESAEALGAPISVGENPSPKATLNRFQVGEPSVSSSPQKLIVPGLNQDGVSANLSAAKVLVTQVRNGAVQKFDLSDPAPKQDLLSQSIEAQTQSSEATPTQEEEPVQVVEVISDRQEYNPQQQVVTAQGNVIMRFAKAVMRADRLQVNLSSRVAVAEGNVVLKRGEQSLWGDRFEYYFVQDSGIILNARGEINQPAAGRDLSNSELIPDQPLTDRLAQRQPLQQITSTGGYQFSAGSTRDISLVGQQGSGGIVGTSSGGQINHIRFEAERIDFYPEGWDATNIRMTNDPFSPPEFEVRADTAKLRNVEPLVDEVILSNSRLVFDQGFSPPIFQNRLVFDRRPRQPGLFQIGFDGDDRGGFFIERPFYLIATEKVSFRLAPQYYLQRAFFPDSFASTAIDTTEGNPIAPQNFGFVTALDIDLGPRTKFRGITNVTSLDLDKIDDNIRSKQQLQQYIEGPGGSYLLSLEYNFRERLFNGSLGFQTVHSSVGVVFVSPVIPIGDTGIDFRYQGSVQNIDADTDRLDLLSANRDNNRTNLTRYQGAATLSRGFLLWQGEALPPTPEEGLRYTPTPVVPYVSLYANLTGVTSFYSNSDSQPSLTGTIGLSGQFGHFSRPFFDYTGFSIFYTQGIRGSESPFLFDRFVDTQTISLGITQQIYGPFRFGIQTSFSLTENNEISTNYFLEYSRRTYNIILQYNPVLSIGSVNLRINDFNWIGDPEPFGGSGIRPVVQGVTR